MESFNMAEPNVNFLEDVLTGDESFETKKLKTEGSFIGQADTDEHQQDFADFPEKSLIEHSLFDFEIVEDIKTGNNGNEQALSKNTISAVKVFAEKLQENTSLKFSKLDVSVLITNKDKISCISFIL
jgi:hypothetical protein